MPLHLLPKKSWHVYNAASIARVRADEAAAAAAQEASEQRMQEIDSERRIALLRGEEPAPLPPSQCEEDFTISGSRDGLQRSDQRARKRRRLRGEDETDAEMRVAREIAAEAEVARERLGGDDGHGKAEARRKSGNDAPLVDEKGHLQLFAPPTAAVTKGSDETSSRRGAEQGGRKNREREQKENEAMGAMRFKDAAGRGNHGQAPWYAASLSRHAPSFEDISDVHAGKSKSAVVLDGVQEKDVWGDSDPRRRERETSRLVSNDPFTAMQRAQTQLKQSERDREAWKKERMRDVDALDEAERRERKHRHRKKESNRSGERKRRIWEDDDLQSLENFSLDAPSQQRSNTHKGKDEDKHEDKQEDEQEGKRKRERHRHRSSHRHHRCHDHNR